ncbi:MAG: GDSL-type esterase/lipase family protein [Eubacteriales bacterium]|nr:GDSL-type esterase/lipase family protein [Eubacteriales bacterium]
MKKAFFYGDSNTYGYDPAGYLGGRYPYAQRWTTILAQGLAGEWEIGADGMPGRVIPAQGRGLSYFRDRLRMEMPVDLFAVMLGTNDLLGTLKPDAQKTAQDMDSLIACVETLSIPQILLIAPPRISLTDFSFEASYVQGDRSYAQRYEEEGRELTRLYRELASRRGILFADASAWDLDFAFDAVHLSEKGHAVFGREMIRVMQAVQNGS